MALMLDVLSDVLRAVRLRGTVYFRAHFQAPWGMALGEKNVAVFHVVTDGCCWLRHGETVTQLAPGDVALFPRGAAHALLSDPHEEPLAAETLLGRPREAIGADAIFGGAGEKTTIVCGHYERASEHPLFDTLPDVVRVSIADRTFHALTKLVVSESSSGESGAGLIGDRLAEALLVQTLRLYALKADVGFVAALADEAIAGALRALHDNPDRDWTVESLAKAGGVSRSVFAARFRERVGESPMQYVGRWRMQRAEQLLTTTQMSVAQIAGEVGYESEFAFSKAFKRVFGIAPGAARRRAHAG